MYTCSRVQPQKVTLKRKKACPFCFLFPHGMDDLPSYFLLLINCSWQFYPTYQLDKSRRECLASAAQAFSNAPFSRLLPWMLAYPTPRFHLPFTPLLRRRLCICLVTKRPLPNAFITNLCSATHINLTPQSHDLLHTHILMTSPMKLPQRPGHFLFVDVCVGPITLGDSVHLVLGTSFMWLHPHGQWPLLLYGLVKEQSATALDSSSSSWHHHTVATILFLSTNVTMELLFKRSWNKNK